MDRWTSRRLTRPVAAILGLITLAFVISPVAAALPPANDELRTATRITALPFAETLDTSGATDSTSDPDSSCVANQGATVFYKKLYEKGYLGSIRGWQDHDIRPT